MFVEMLKLHVGIGDRGKCSEEVGFLTDPCYIRIPRQMLGRHDGRSLEVF